MSKTIKLSIPKGMSLLHQILRENNYLSVYELPDRPADGGDGIAYAAKSDLIYCAAKIQDLCCRVDIVIGEIETMICQQLVLKRFI